MLLFRTIYRYIQAMLNKLVAISLIISLGGTLMRFTIPYASYFANYNYIVDHLCVNRNHPEMHCNGKCQLKKMIKKEEHDHAGNKSTNTVNHNQRIDFFIVHGIHKNLSLRSQAGLYCAFQARLNSLYFSEPLSPPPQYT